ncbi:MAG: UbiA family prenyltransferase [Hyphomonadaceae bacterium]|nr:UbiA family prenyltransferase [Hyphomonadaceae bacterium]
MTPLAVDMDHTLLKTDLLMEGVAAALLHRPLRFLAALPTIFLGRPAFKRAIAKAAPVDAETLPMREDVLDFLRGENARGREIHLYTAADAKAAQAVARRIGMFASVEGSEGRRNLKGRAKRDALRARFPNGFAYAGDSRADLPIWRAASSAVLVGVGASIARAVGKHGTPIEATLPSHRGLPDAWPRALRMHQWVKNLLLFAPLLLAQKFWDTHAVLQTICGVGLLCLAASAGYVFNDLADLAHDRRHPTKRLRPLAAGEVSIGESLLFAPTAMALALVLGFALDPGFGIALAIYLGANFLYTAGLKKLGFLDVFILGGFYTLRLVMGAETAMVEHSQWLLTFSMFFFISLSLAKRHVELMRLMERDGVRAQGRGYRAEDWPLTLTFGAASGVAAVLILVLYLVNEAFPAALYDWPMWLWTSPAVASLVIGRIWVKAHRKELDDDPVVFGMRDPAILSFAAILFVAFALASIR